LIKSSAKVALMLFILMFHKVLFDNFNKVMLNNKELPWEEDEERAKPLYFIGRILL
jgi:hypothetical protein